MWNPRRTETTQNTGVHKGTDSLGSCFVQRRSSISVNSWARIIFWSGYLSTKACISRRCGMCKDWWGVRSNLTWPHWGPSRFFLKLCWLGWVRVREAFVETVSRGVWICNQYTVRLNGLNFIRLSAILNSACKIDSHSRSHISRRKLLHLPTVYVPSMTFNRLHSGQTDRQPLSWSRIQTIETESIRYLQGIAGNLRQTSQFWKFPFKHSCIL